MKPKIHLEKVYNGIDGIEESFGKFMAVSCVVCFHSQRHQSGIVLPVNLSLIEEEKKEFEVHWDGEVDDNLLKSYKDQNRTTDFGAMCMSILLTLELTDYSSFETSATNNGFDFWLARDDGELEFSGRLEISGIRKETNTNNVRTRLKQKKKQVKKSDDLDIPAYISIIEFGDPKAAYIEKLGNE